MKALVLMAAIALVGCSGSPPDSMYNPMSATIDMGGDKGGDSGAALHVETYPTIASLHEVAMARTCSLNNGVCHNSKEYPDLHTLSNLLDAIGAPCNVSVADKKDYKDACEPAGDHIVIPSVGVDAEIAYVEILEDDATLYDWPKFKPNLKTPAARVTLAAPLPPFVIPPEAQQRFAIQRGGISFPMRVVLDQGSTNGAYLQSASGNTITIGLNHSDYRIVKLINGFWDDRTYPWTTGVVRVADPNHNGVLGHAHGMSLLVAGQPDRSYLFQRLIDPAQGDLMPRVCRAWDERATRALGCWIEGLKTDQGGLPVNAWDPIDFTHCRTDTAARGLCFSATGDGASLAAVESLFARACGGSACHIGQSAGGLELTRGKARASLVDVAAAGAPDRKRVRPGSPAESYLMCKLNPNCAAMVGARMPSGAPPLTSDDIALLSAWILGGAN